MRRRRGNRGIPFGIGLSLFGFSLNLINLPIMRGRHKIAAITIEERNPKKLKAYYTQKPVYQFDKKLKYDTHEEQYYVEFKRSLRGAYINLVDRESIENVQQLEGKYVDVFGLRDEPQERTLVIQTDFFTGGVTPTRNKSGRTYTLSFTLTHHDMYHQPESFLETKKAKITVKELDFALRKHLISMGVLYNGANADMGTITFKMHDGTSKQFELNRRLPDAYANHIVDSANIKDIFVNII